MAAPPADPPNAPGPADPNDASTREAKKKFLLTASFEEQEALLAPPPEPVPTPPRRLSSQPHLRAYTERRGPTPLALGVHPFPGWLMVCAVMLPGTFAWIVDPDGNKVELWEPKKAG